MDAHLCLGAVYFEIGELDKALKELKKAEILTSDKEALGAIYNILGQTYYRKRDLDNALFYFNKVLLIARKLGYKNVEAAQLNNIANIYADKGEFEKAIKYYEESLKLTTTEEDKATTYCNLAVLYSQLEDYKKAFEYYKKCIEIEERIGDYHGLAITFLNLGNTFRKTKDYENAFYYLDEGLKRIKKISDKRGEALGYEYLGLLYIDKGDMENAKKYLREAYELFLSIGADEDAKDVAEIYNEILKLSSPKTSK